jgi:hypothetical protein
MTCSQGIKGRLKASGKEFEIVAVTATTSTIKFRWERDTHEIKDSELKELADQIERFSE